MRLTLLESDRSFLHTAELVTLSIAVHVTALVFVAITPAESFRLPADEREARVLAARTRAPRPAAWTDRRSG